MTIAPILPSLTLFSPKRTIYHNISIVIPADDYVEKTLDLNELLVQKPAATFFARAQGNSMIGTEIFLNDILVVYRSVEPVSGKKD